jgi:hypothetical protein
MNNPAGANDPFVDPALLAAQYSAMRAEMIKRLEIRSQLVALTLVVAGTFLSVGAQSAIPESVLLVYPLIAMFLAASWKQNDVRTGQMVRFIRDKIEKHIGASPTELGWENYRRATHPPSRLTPFSVSGVFLATQGLAIALSAVRFVPLALSLIQSASLSNTTAELVIDAVLLAVAVASMIATIFILRRRRF